MRHVWLPIEFNTNGTIKPLEWHDEWQIDAKTGLAVIPATTKPMAANLAKGKRVSATYDSSGEMFGYSHYANHEPSLAVDGGSKTAWIPKDNLAHWFKLDLLEPMDISGTRVTFWNAGANDYQIAVSTDAENWKTVAHTTSTPARKTVHDDFTERKIRYLRVYLLKTNSGYHWPGIRELAVYSNGVNVARDKPVTADDFQARTDATKAVDGDFSTAWTIDNDQLPQSITIDVGALQAIGGVRILWETAGVAYCYRIETSADQTKWKLAVDETGNTVVATQPKHHFHAKARYIRVTLNGYDKLGDNPRSGWMNPWPGIREIEVFK